jgi:3'-phosphoadenosine 5'-phosphosulfate (PAPS) 3'-phosphatase
VILSLNRYTVDDLVIPEQFYDDIDRVRSDVDNLSQQIDASAFQDISVFIDPIDGTREFATGLGEQCSICIGFSNAIGRPVAGLGYRPIPQPPTWAAGAPAEGWIDSELDRAPEPNTRGFLTSNGGISKFIER